jgi:hypothetical protein
LVQNYFTQSQEGQLVIFLGGIPPSGDQKNGHVISTKDLLKTFQKIH